MWQEIEIYFGYQETKLTRTQGLVPIDKMGWIPIGIRELNGVIYLVSIEVSS